MSHLEPRRNFSSHYELDLACETELEEVGGDVCDFYDSVEVEVWDYQVYWTCPKCGTEHQEDAERVFPTFND